MKTIFSRALHLRLVGAFSRERIARKFSITLAKMMLFSDRPGLFRMELILAKFLARVFESTDFDYSRQNDVQKDLYMDFFQTATIFLSKFTFLPIYLCTRKLARALRQRQTFVERQDGLGFGVRRNARANSAPVSTMVEIQLDAVLERETWSERGFLFSSASVRTIGQDAG